jgi:hypothetical protein
VLATDDSGSSLVYQLFEPANVDLVRSNLQHVSRRDCVNDIDAQHLPNLRDVDTQGLESRGWRVLAPQLLEQPVGRDNVIEV